VNTCLAELVILVDVFDAENRVDIRKRQRRIPCAPGGKAFDDTELVTTSSPGWSLPVRTPAASVYV
jgi:hypothetical protein